MSAGLPCHADGRKPYGALTPLFILHILKNVAVG
jgi:hypothetical protein